jgi:hypothetical protein
MELRFIGINVYGDVAPCSGSTRTGGPAARDALPRGRMVRHPVRYADLRVAEIAALDVAGTRLCARAGVRAEADRVGNPVVRSVLMGPSGNRRGLRAVGIDGRKPEDHQDGFGRRSGHR